MSVFSSVLHLPQSLLGLTGCNGLEIAHNVHIIEPANRLAVDLNSEGGSI